MNRLGKLLQPLIDAEQRGPGPVPEAIADCWVRIAADVQRGSFPPLDVPPLAPPRSPFLWLAVVLVGAGLVGGGVYASRDSAERARDPAVAQPKIAPSAAPAPTIVAVAPDPPPVPSAEPAEPVKNVEPVAPVAAKPRPSRPTAPTATVDEDTFAAELRLLAQGQAALNRDDHAGALKIADRYRHTYPRGHFTEDGDALRAVALCSAGAPRATAAARRFLRAYPTSIHASRVRDSCAMPADAL